MFDEISKEKIELPKINTITKQLTKYELNTYQKFGFAIWIISFVLGIILGFIPCLLITIILLALGLMNALDFILINIPLFLFIVVTNYIGIYIDLRRPKLEWENETVAVKQNTNTIIYMFLDWALTMIIVAFGVIIIFIRIPAFVASLILSLIFLGLYVIIYRLMKNKGLEIFNNIG